MSHVAYVSENSLNFSAKILYSFNEWFKLLAFFFNADLCIMASHKGLLFPLIIFDFNGVCVYSTLRN